MSQASPAAAATYKKSRGGFKVILNCSAVYGSSGSPIGYSVSSGKWRYTKSVPALCEGSVGIYLWGFLQLDESGYSVPAFKGGWKSGSHYALTRKSHPSYPHNQVRTKTVNGERHDWRTFGIALYAKVESSAWKTCETVDARYMYQPYYNRWLTRSRLGPWLP